MSARRIDDVLKLLSPVAGFRPWHGGASPLGSLRGLSAGEASWKPAPDRHSIWELTLHIAYWKYAVRRRLVGGPTGSFPRRPSNWPAVPDPADEKAWKEDRALLREEHERLVEAIRAFDPSRYDEPATGGKGAAADPMPATTFGDLIMGVLMHDTYHTGQIQLLKRLYRNAE